MALEGDDSSEVNAEMHSFLDEAAGGTAGGAAGTKRGRPALSKTMLLGLALALVVVFFVGLEAGLAVGSPSAESGVESIDKAPLLRGSSSTETPPDPAGSLRGGGGGAAGEKTEEEAPKASLAADDVAVRARVKSAREELKIARDKLFASYGRDELFFANAKRSTETSGDSSFLVAKMKRAMLGPDGSFVMSAAGSSVSAGHDNFGYQAWPRVLGRELKPLWAHFGVNFTMRNQAVGGRNPNPHSLCLKPMLGDDADVVLREWEYWQFYEGFMRSTFISEKNEARDVRPTDTPRDRNANAAGLEVFLRMALGLENQPAVHFVFLNYDHPPDTDPLAYWNVWFEEGGIFSAYGDNFAVNAFDTFGIPFDHLRKKAKWPRYSKDLDDQGRKKNCENDAQHNVGTCPVDYEKQDGYHKGLLFVNWHPGPLGHTTIAKQLGYFYMGLMLTAADEILTEKKDLTSARTKAMQQASPRALPPPQLCNPTICTTTPRCAYSYLPKAQGPDVGDWMINDTQHGWLNQFAHNQKHCRDDEYFEQKCFAHSRAQSENCRDCLRTRTHLDRKRAFQGGKGSGTLSLRIDPPMDQCRVWLCEPPYEWMKSDKTANFDTDLRFKVNGSDCTKANGCYSVQQTGYKQCGVLDFKDLTKGRCKDSWVRVDVDVDAVEHPPDDACRYDPGERTCHLQKAWDGTEGEDRYCRSHGAGCKAQGSREADTVTAYISEVIVM